MKKIMLIMAVVLSILIIVIIQRGAFLKYEKSYTLTNEHGKAIPSKIFSRKIQTKTNGKKESVYEILIFFDDNKNMKHYNPLVIIPKYKMIGMVEGGKKEFWLVGNKIYQLSDKSNKFTSLDNAVFFDNPPIKEVHFLEKKITFNSFEGLKKYGQTIILKK